MPELDLQQGPRLTPGRLVEAGSWTNELHLQTFRSNRCKVEDHILEVKMTKEAMKGIVGEADPVAKATLDSKIIAGFEREAFEGRSFPFDFP